MSSQNMALVFSDLHTRHKHLTNLVDCAKRSGKYSVLIFAGDALNMGEPVGFINDFTKAVENTGLPLMWVPGNNDFGHGYHRLNARFRSLEGRVVDFGGHRYTGVGGSPASWSGQYAGEKMVDKKSIAGSIFVSHMPPPGILVMQKSDCQSPTGKKLSDAPLLHICGHNHSRWGCGYLGTTKVVNPGSLADGRYAELDLDSLRIKFDRFAERTEINL